MAAKPNPFAKGGKKAPAKKAAAKKPPARKGSMGKKR